MARRLAGNLIIESSGGPLNVRFFTHHSGCWEENGLLEDHRGSGGRR